ncbi:DUF4238 domain-containing protein [Pseudolysinimonas sp.]|jgi:hypothetical protein|uniref:DUF4238 domain-containing protein n=1 Tax=Pseudolysinimonas sp. TaxID=2680009 RepID=UPI003783F3DC
MTAAKRHHTVPQFYLRGFASGEQIATVALPGDRRFVQSVRKAGSETNFYTVPEAIDGPDVFEKSLSEIEGEAARIFALIECGVWPLAEEDRGTLAFFVALQVARGPDQRRNMEHIAAQMTRLEIGHGGRDGVKAWAKSRRGVDISDELAEKLWDQATQPGGPPIQVTALAHIQQMLELAKELLKYTSGRPWTLVRFDRRSLITSDTPVSLVARPDHDPAYGVGFMTAWGITYPLTRKLGLLMSDPSVWDGAVAVERVRAGEFDRVEDGTTKMEKFFNLHTALGASQWLYHHPEDEKFVPAELPEPTPVTIRMSGGEYEFSGEPTFGPRVDES